MTAHQRRLRSAYLQITLLVSYASAHNSNNSWAAPYLRPRSKSQAHFPLHAKHRRRKVVQEVSCYVCQTEERSRSDLSLLQILVRYPKLLSQKKTKFGKPLDICSEKYTAIITFVNEMFLGMLAFENSHESPGAFFSKSYYLPQYVWSSCLAIKLHKLILG